MSADRYSLLTLERRKGQDGKPQVVLGGPLAPALEPKIRKESVLFRSLAALTRLAPGQRLDLLSADAGFLEDDQFFARTRGLLAPLFGGKINERVRQGVKNKLLINRPIARRGHQRIFTLYQPPMPSAPAVKAVASRLIHDATGRPRPSTATLQITARCQADCYHCSAARHRVRHRQELSTEELKSVIRQTEALGIVHIVFTGGEPLLRPDIYELISYVNKDEAIVMIFTNGILLTAENVARLRAAGLFSLNVSIDSPDPKTHDDLRRVPGCFEKALAGMKRVIDAGILCGISTYATPERLRNGQVMELIELARSIGCHEVTIFDTVPTGKLLRGEESILLSDEDKAELCRIEEDINAREGWPHIITQAHVNGPTGAGCFAAWFQYYMTAYGDVMPCDFTPLTFGNLREEPLARIWERMISHPAYREHCRHCRMQDADFRAKWIDVIPDSGPFPYPAMHIQPGRQEIGRAHV